MIAKVQPFSRLHCLDYTALPGCAPGSIVSIPLGTRSTLGVVLQFAESSVPIEKLKTIAGVLPELALPTVFLAFIEKLTRYYQCGLSEALVASLPTLLRQGKIPPALPVLEYTPLKPAVLTEAQSTAFTALPRVSKHSVSVIEGITGSGKTEVYLAWLALFREQKGQILLLVPEIGLTPALLSRVEERLGMKPFAYHSGLTPKGRYSVFSLVKSGAPVVIVGTRSAVLLPFQNLTAVVVDEEHDSSYKQDQGSFRYHARDVAIWLAHLHDAPLALCTATPALETYHRIKTLGWNHIPIHTRAQGELPTLSILDTRHKQLKEGISHQGLEKIAEAIAKGQQVLVFKNRRGFAPVWICKACGSTQMCPQCDMRLTWHKKDALLKCHYCSSAFPVPPYCETCQAPMGPFGVGTERLDDLLSETFPHVPIIRFDRDTANGKKNFNTLMEAALAQSPAIIVGTQMLAKGHNFPKVALALILGVDGALVSTDFRAPERLIQLITQVAGRAGRTAANAEVFLETIFPDHPLLQQLIQKGYASTALSLLEIRETHALPPFSHAAIVRAEAKSMERAHNALLHLIEKLPQKTPNPLELLGPLPVGRRQNYYRTIILLLSKQRATLKSYLAKLRKEASLQKGVRILFDVDPNDWYN